MESKKEDTNNRIQYCTDCTCANCPPLVTNVEDEGVKLAAKVTNSIGYVYAYNFADKIVEVNKAIPFDYINYDQNMFVVNDLTGEIISKSNLNIVINGYIISQAGANIVQVGNAENLVNKWRSIDISSEQSLIIGNTIMPFKSGDKLSLVPIVKDLILKSDQSNSGNASINFALSILVL